LAQPQQRPTALPKRQAAPVSVSDGTISLLVWLFTKKGVAAMTGYVDYLIGILSGIIVFGGYFGMLHLARRVRDGGIKRNVYGKRGKDIYR